MKVPRDIVSTYHFGGLPLFDAKEGMRLILLDTSAQSHLQENAMPKPSTSVRALQQPMSHGVLLPTTAT